MSHTATSSPGAAKPDEKTTKSPPFSYDYTGVQLDDDLVEQFMVDLNKGDGHLVQSRLNALLSDTKKLIANTEATAIVLVMARKAIDCVITNVQSIQTVPALSPPLHRVFDILTNECRDLMNLDESATLPVIREMRVLLEDAVLALRDKEPVLRTGVIITVTEQAVLDHFFVIPSSKTADQVAYLAFPASLLQTPKK